MYEPIASPPPPERYERDLARFDRVQARWMLLREALGERWTVLASRDEERRAAVETGAIEGLYRLDECVTQTLIREGLDSEAGRALDSTTFDLIAAQQHAIDVVTGSVVRDEPITVSLIRELHQAVTAGQATYVATDQFGRQFRRDLAKGQWKDQDNSVTLPGGATLDFAPAVQVDAEVDRFVAMMADLEGAPWAYRAAVAHHLLTHIHPFADGNGRTARLLATHQFLRGGLPGLVVEDAARVPYLAALAIADTGDLAPLLLLFSSSLRSTLRRVEDRAFEPSTRDLAGLSDVARAVRMLRNAAPADDVDAVFSTLTRQARELLRRRLQQAATDLDPEGAPPRVNVADGSLGLNSRVRRIPNQLASDVFRATTTVHGQSLIVSLAFAVVQSPAGHRSVHALALGRDLDVDLIEPEWQVIERWIDAAVGDVVVDLH